MVLITVKSGSDLQFLFETPAKARFILLYANSKCERVVYYRWKTEIERLREEIRKIYNGRLKIERLTTEIGQLAEYGTILPENMQGLNEDQIIDLKLVDPWTSKCIPSGGAIQNKGLRFCLLKIKNLTGKSRYILTTKWSKAEW